MNKSKLLDAIRSERSQWEALLAQVNEAHMSERGVAGEWSLKDIIAHITWFEREMIVLLQKRALVGSELWQVSQAERNAAIFEENRQQSLQDVLAEAPQVYEQLIELVQALTDEDVTDARRFAEMPSEWQPWQVIAGNTYEHYRDHSSDVRAWLDKRDKD